MFKRYECGCVGFVTNAMEPGHKRVMCVQACDEHERPYSFVRRDTLQEKPSRKLSDDEIEELLDVIAELVSDGYAMRELRCALRVAGIETR